MNVVDPLRHHHRRMYRATQFTLSFICRRRANLIYIQCETIKGRTPYKCVQAGGSGGIFARRASTAAHAFDPLSTRACVRTMTGCPPTPRYVPGSPGPGRPIPRQSPPTHDRSPQIRREVRRISRRFQPDPQYLPCFWGGFESSIAHFHPLQPLRMCSRWLAHLR